MCRLISIIYSTSLGFKGKEEEKVKNKCRLMFLGEERSRVILEPCVKIRPHVDCGKVYASCLITTSSREPVLQHRQNLGGVLLSILPSASAQILMLDQLRHGEKRL